jgi:hypothetical protein
MRAILSLILLGTVGMISGCSGAEGKAEKMYEESMSRIEAGELQEGVALLQKILVDYPDTEVAATVREEIEIFRGLAGAVENYPVSSARDLMVRTARVLERRRARRRLPGSLEELVPHTLQTVPVDPWGEELVYVRSENRRGYTLRCLGSDGVPGGGGAAADITIRNGRFVEGGW